MRAKVIDSNGRFAWVQPVTVAPRPVKTALAWIGEATARLLMGLK